ncbi:MAG: metalloregulator ArsR/SmtB family transcription factor [Proteobacteria bacterium]|nr:helix-turn-helix transcriptional regulator [Desulfobulbaceae bacterium]MBU4152589.1 metalloregulator ArsR/SmtB family transcription factor [Pseudomonadota bacterium]
MHNSTVASLAKIMKSIGHPIRLKILCLLVDGGQTVGEIHDQLTTSFANVSQHLQRLHHQGLVVTDKQANFVRYSIASPKVTEMIGTLRRLYCRSLIDNETVKSQKSNPMRNKS